MNHIILTAEQTQIVLQANQILEVHDGQGRTVAHLAPLEPADMDLIEKSKQSQKNSEPRISSEQVQTYFRRLTEIDAEAPLDEAKMLDLLRPMRAGEAV
jgi:hypothetical protein